MWTAELVFFEGEDEGELLKQFVELSARWPNYPPTEIAAYIFRDLRDPTLRGAQAAMRWSQDLTVRERIRIAKLNGGVEPVNGVIDEKEKVLTEVLTAARDTAIAPKDRAKFYELWLQSKGVIGAKKDDAPGGGNPALPAVVISEYSDDDNSASIH